MLMSTSLCNQGSNLLRLARHRQINARIHELGFLWHGPLGSPRPSVGTSGHPEKKNPSRALVREFGRLFSRR
jgi:hypothetical protein